MSPEFCCQAKVYGFKHRIFAVIKDLEILKNEAAEKKFPDNELLRRLGGVLKDIEHCQRASTELLRHSPR